MCMCVIIMKINNIDKWWNDNENEMIILMCVIIM